MERSSLTLKQQIDAFNRQSRPRMTEPVIAALTSPIQQLTDARATERALKEGDRVADFTLPDAVGRPVTLSSLLSDGPVVIAFYRGEWCPYCNLQLRAYQNVLGEIRARGASLIAISPQTPDHSMSMAEKHQLGFPVLSDAGNTVARQFGLVFTIDQSVRGVHEQVGANLSAFNGDDSWELPMAGTYIVDSTGTVRLAFVDPDFTHRLEPAAILQCLDELATC